MKSRCAVLCGLGLVVLFSAASSFAVDGVVLINQNVATGGLGSCDTPGFPVTICQAGSYKLSGNLTVPDSNTTAIEITSANVSLDLNGFAISGPNVCSGSPLVCSANGNGSGVFVTSNVPGVSIRNGTVSGMGEWGIRSFAIPPNTVVVDHVQVSSNGFHGVGISSGDVSYSTAVRNGGTGLAVSNGSISFSRAEANGNGGIFVSFGLISNSISRQNGGNGLDISIGVVSKSLSLSNGGFGLSGASGVGYDLNNFTSNGQGAVSSGVSMGNNLCSGVKC